MSATEQSANVGARDLSADPRARRHRTDRLGVISNAERAELLALGDGGPALQCSASTLWDLVHAQAERTPDAIAIIDGDNVLTYRQVCARASGVALRLQQLGAAPESHIGVLADRSAESLIGVLAVLAAGSAYVPIDASMPDERVQFVLADAEIRILLASRAVAARTSRQCIVIEDILPSTSLPQSRACGSNAAYVMYTSGSTGKPKGVVIDHRGAINLVCGFLERHPFVGQRLLMVPPPFFDASVGDIFPVLAVGATLVLHRDPAGLAGAELERFCTQHRVTAIDAPAALWRRWVEEWANQEGPVRCPGLQLMMIGGEAVSADLARKFLRMLGGRVALTNHYGPTEATVCASLARILDPAEISEIDLPIGRPLPGVQLYVVDEQLQLVPRGTEGELCIAGVGIARGYLGAPALTAMSFIEDPFAAKADARMYRTGDLVRWTADGSLQFLGRRDSQVKIRGFRIELGEIEAALAAAPGVREAVVVARDQASGDKQLVAYVIAAEPAASKLEIEVLRSHLGTRLPAYMIPAAYVLMESFPLTANGKLDRKALPAPQSDAYRVREYQAPRGSIESTLARIWAQVLKVEHVGRYDNFFELGGHSLLAVELIEQMRRAGLVVDVRVLFEKPVLLHLAAELSESMLVEAAPGVEVPPNGIPARAASIRPEMLPLVQLSQQEIDRIVAAVPGGAGNVQDIYPLAPLQEGFLFHHLLETEGDVYLALTLFSFAARDLIDRYAQALQAVIDRHDILRTAVMWEGLAEPVQVVWRTAQLRIEERSFDPAAGDIATQLSADVDPRHYRLDVRQAPMWRLFLAQDPVNHRWVVAESMHHLIGDHVTAQIMQREIQAFMRHRASELPPPVPFRNFVAQARLSVSRAEHEVFFRQMLADVDEPTAPFGLLDVQGDGRRIVEAHREVEPALNQRLRSCARALGVSTASLCHLAWALVLARTCGRDDVVFGTVMFGRMQGGAGADRVMGMFINTLPLRIELRQQSVQQCARRTHERLVQLLKHEHAPLALAQRCSGVQSPMPLFTSLLNYRFVAAGEAALVRDAVDLSVEGGMKLLSGYERANYPLDLSVNDSVTGLSLDVQVDAAVEAQRVCELMHGALQGLVEALEHHPELAVSTLQVLPAAERRQVLEHWNQTQTCFAPARSITELFEQQVVRTPDAVAVVHRAERLSYAQLNCRANQLAHHLRSLGVKPEERVAICLERSIEMLEGLLAVLKCGGAYVPLDPAYAAARLTSMLEDCAPRVLLTDARVGTQSMLSQARVPAALTLLNLQSDREQWAQAPTQNLDPQSCGIGPHTLAYVIYTSGSTGQPKGVMVEQASVLNLIQTHIRIAELSAADRVLQFASFSFDASVEEIFPPLAVGARIVLRPQQMLAPDESYERLLREEQITVVELPTAFWQQWAQQQEPSQPWCPRLVVVGGEKAELRDLQRWRGGARGQGGWLNTYGPTEATVYATSLLIRAGQELEEGPISIGRPICNTRIYLLDAHRQPVVAGAVGELYIGGAGVARGYLSRAELTAERFIDSPFVPAQRLYRSGDLARWRADGTLEYLGRNDLQLKIRGFRIEPGEIEAQLATHPAVREVVVIARDQQQLVAYLTARGERTRLDIEELRHHANVRLPPYMVPAAYVVLEQLPLTVSGKLDRKALPPPQGDAFPTRDYQEPQGEIEQTIAAIWAQLLKHDRIGRHDNFFELGGHSLLAVTLSSRLREALGTEVALQELFAFPVLSELAGQISSRTRTQHEPITPRSRPELLPLSLTQRSLWFVAQMAGGSEAYHIPLALHLQGDLDRSALQRALNRIVERHEALRTCFRCSAEQTVQCVVSGLEFPLRTADLRSLADPGVPRQLSEEAARPFDLERGPLIRALLLQIEERAHLLMITMHHIVSDGWSLGVLMRELRELYRAFSTGAADPLAPLPLQYADYTLWQQERLTGARLTRQREYWGRRLAGAPSVLALPTDRPRPASQSFQGDVVNVRISAELTRALKERAQRRGMTLYMMALAGWAAVLSRLSGQDDIVIGTPTANRTRGEFEDLIGFFVNTQALRIAVRGDTDELLDEVREAVLEAQEHADLTFDQVVAVAKPPRSSACTPIFQVLLAWQSADDAAFALPGLTLRPAEVSYGVAKCDLELDLQERDGQIVGELRYATSLFDRASIERHIGYLLQALSALATQPAMPIDRIDLLDDAERTLLLHDWNQLLAEQASPHAHGRCVHEIFEMQAAGRLEATAVVHGSQVLTYGELNRQANQVAHHLRSLGVRPGDRVALCMARGLSMIVGILATLKAGAAYVPLDPEYPDERLAYMLRDSEPRAILTAGLTRDVLADRPVSAVLLDLDRDADQWRGLSGTNPDREALGLTDEHVAYVIYTSGSTGAPKGVMVEHRNVVRLFAATQPWYGFDAADVWTLFHSFAFDFSVWELWGALLHGGRLVIVPQAVTRAPDEFYHLICEQRVTVLNQTPSAFTQLISAQARSTSAHALKYVIFGGEALDLGALGPWYERNAEDRPLLVNMYGITETTVHVTYRPLCAADLSRHRGRSPIGVRIPDLRLYILDAHRQPVPIGAVGELYVGGAGVARGYLNRQELTAERFIENPFVRGERLYRSGDLARWRAAGTIEYLGRNDFQVKIRGFRIELGEIEAALAAAPGVREAVVVARDQASGDKQLVAYVIAAEPAASKLEIEVLRSHLGTRLPAYMIPAAYVLMESFPLTANGKLDRKALPAPQSDAYRVREYEAPRGDTEGTLAQIWAQVLKVDRVGRYDNFFELGGHSLLVIRAIEQLRRAGLAFAVADLFNHADVASLAAQARNTLPETQPHGAGAPSTAASAAAVRIRGGTQTPLFLMHDGYGDELYFPVLAQHLSPTLPVYGLPPLRRDEPPAETVEAMAARMVRLIRAEQPAGPYRLAGWSFGGLLAYEVAQQLLRDADEVEFLALIDTFSADGEPLPTNGGPGPEVPASFEYLSAQAVLEQRRYREMHERAMSRYRAAPIGTRVDLFLASERGHDMPAALSSALGWERYVQAGSLHVRGVPGTHESMMKPPNVRALGAALSQALAQGAGTAASQRREGRRHAGGANGVMLP